MNHQRYRHTQTGWAIIGAMIAVAAVSSPIVAAIGPGTLPIGFVVAILSVITSVRGNRAGSIVMLCLQLIK